MTTMACRTRRSAPNKAAAQDDCAALRPYGSAVRMPAGLTCILSVDVLFSALPSNEKAISSFSTMHWATTYLESLDHTMPWHQWPILASVTGVRSVPEIL